METTHLSLKAIVALFAISFIMFLSGQQSFHSFGSSLTNPTGNVVTFVEDYDDIDTTGDDLGFYSNHLRLNKVQAYGVEESAGQWDNRRSNYYSDDYNLVSGKTNFNYKSKIDYVVEEDNKPKGKVFLKRTFEVYPDYGEVRLMVELSDQDGVDRIMYPQVRQHRGQASNALELDANRALYCNNKLNCKTNYYLAENVRDPFNSFIKNGFTFKFSIKDGKGNMIYGELTPENNWQVIYE